MWSGRADAIRSLMSDGRSFTAATKSTFDQYDTVKWLEIPSRIWRARGVLFQAARGLCYDFKTRNLITSCENERKGFKSQAAELQQLCRDLVGEVARFPLLPQEKGRLPESDQSKPDWNTEIKITIPQLLGWFKQAHRFVSKCAHDIPLIPEKIHTPPTLVQRARICVEVARIMAALDVIAMTLSVEPSPPAKIDKRKTIDVYGLGKPFSTWVANAFRAEDMPFEKTIVTHARPDADAVVATWMAERFIFAGKRCRVRFVTSRFGPIRMQSRESALSTSAGYTIRWNCSSIIVRRSSGIETIPARPGWLSNI